MINNTIKPAKQNEVKSQKFCRFHNVKTIAIIKNCKTIGLKHYWKKKF